MNRNRHIVLNIHQLGKAYRKYNSQWRRIFSWFGVPVKPIEEQWVLRYIDLTISQGEAVGIVGQNGAGKSTLLKLVTGTQIPSEGWIQVKGRFSAILELGMGFNMEFTGRENAYHGLGLMGFNHHEINELMPKVEEFAEIGEYFDQPMRTYSSGMQMRVAFAVVTAFQPDILIIDEALSVGDAYFQHKSFKRIRELQKQGTTLLIVSHDRTAIQGLCERAILLDRGSIIKDGYPDEVMDFYNALIAEKEKTKVEVRKHASGKIQTVSGTGAAQVEEIGLFNAQGEGVEAVGVGEMVELRIRVQIYKPISTLVLGYMIKDRLGQSIFGTNTYHTEQVIRRAQAGEHISYLIRFPSNLGIGSYSITTALTGDKTHLSCNYEWRDLALVFNVYNHRKIEFVGCAWIQPQIEIERS